MDMGSAARQPVHVRVDNNQDVTVGGPSRLCNLSDAILIHILSFLPMKDAVRTSILSKSWVYLWTSLPDLRFNDIKFIERALLLRDPQHAMNSFSLRAKTVKDDLPRISTCIAAAIRSKVQELSLELYDDEDGNDYPYVLPFCMYTCQTLVKLNLDLGCKGVLRIPSSVQLPSLKVLHLSQVKFADDASVQKLFSCPLLEVLSILSCDWEDIRAGSISAPKLRHLTIVDEWDSHGYQVTICGANLKSFKYIGRLWNGYHVVGTCTKLVKAKIAMLDYESQLDFVADHGYNLLRSLSSTMSLSLTSDFFKALKCKNNAEELLESLPVFHNLTDLMVEVDDTSLDGTFFAVLKKFCHLQSLEISLQICPISQAPWKGDELEDVPPCFLTHLKKIKLEGFGGSNGDFHLAGILLKSCMVLDEMIFECTRALTKFDMKEVRSLPRGSKNCRFTVLFV